jgi:excinuclease UvrABC nuclease subunit
MNDKPGVYIFLDKNKKPLYVGRALSLKRRVANYFQNNLEPRIKEMVSLSKNIKIIETDTIVESVILEANLIKKYWPKYNIKDRDNRSFVYIVIDKGDFPKPIIVREREVKKIPHSDYVFGPYRSSKTASIVLKIIRRIFPYSTCSFTGKPCFNYQIGLCPGVCTGEVSKKDYQKNIDNIILFLKGEKKRLLKKLMKENPESAESLKHIQDISLISKEDYDEPSFNRIEAYDVSHLSGTNAYGAMVVFINNKPDKSLYRLFKIKMAPDDLRSLEEMILRRLKHKEWPFPSLILLDGGKPQIDFISSVLDKENISIPLVGISKYSNDKLVFKKNTKNSLKELIKSNKDALLKAREEAHRFSIKSNRRKRRIY